MELKQLEAFVSVVEEGSFSGAAKRMFLTQPTISTHIATLEKEMKVKLFERTTKHLSLTEDGRQLFGLASRMLELKKAMQDYSRDAGKDRICLGASTIPSGYLLPAVTEKFIRKHKDCRIVMKYGNSREIEEMVCDGTVSFGVIGKKSERNELESQFLCKDELVIAVPANNRFERLLKSKAPRDKVLAMLLKNPVILREDGSGTGFAAERLLDTAGSGKVIMRSNDQEAIKHMVAGGAGVSIMSAYAATDMVEGGKMLTYPIGGEAPRSFYIIFRKDAQLKEADREYIELALREYTE
ncbi:MAG: LysR family transcriptional regulator [Lachnospiraceae bacterium]|nr:LysR family transcriptional regulator [Lachnospiraceae bacterium]